MSTQLYSATRTLSDAEIKALPTLGTIGYEIVPAAGNGKVLVFISGYVSVDTNAGEYENVAALAAAYFRVTSMSASVRATEANAAMISEWLGFGANAYISFGPHALLDAVNDIVNAPFAEEVDTNVPLRFVLTSTDGDLTGGNAANTMKIVVLYTIIDV